MTDLHGPPGSDATAEQAPVWTIDRWLWRIVSVACGILILLTVVFTCYTVYMRYVVGDPPFWGDTVALFANIWMVLLALALSVRRRDQIAMQALYARISPAFAFWLEILWTVMILVFAVILVTFLVDLAYAWVDPRLRQRT